MPMSAGALRRGTNVPCTRRTQRRSLQCASVEPLISRLQLRQLTTYFPKADHKYPLDPEHEPEDEHGNVKEPVNKEKVAIAQLFKAYRDAGFAQAIEPQAATILGSPSLRDRRARAARTGVLVACSQRKN